MAKNTKKFKVSEFNCKCVCSFNNIDQRIIDMAHPILEELGVPIRVNSACRCEKHNTRVGGVKGNFTRKKLAADLSSST